MKVARGFSAVGLQADSAELHVYCVDVFGALDDCAGTKQYGP